MAKFFIAVAVGIASLVGLLAALVGLFVVSTPRPDDIKGCLTTAMYKVELCPTKPNYVKLSQISKAARDAVLLSEDAGFWDHDGFDWNELRASFETNLEKGQFARGGSTITQQLAKNVYLSPEKSVLRKLREAVITIQLEKMLTKNEIFEKYLNVVEFGENLYGIKSAARHYFNKSPSTLTPVEGAFLAVLLPNPKAYSVSFRKKALSPYMRKQTREIVNRLLRFKRISQDEYQTALAQLNSMFGPAPADESSEMADDTGLNDSNLRVSEERKTGSSNSDAPPAYESLGRPSDNLPMPQDETPGADLPVDVE